MPFDRARGFSDIPLYPEGQTGVQAAEGFLGRLESEDIGPAGLDPGRGEWRKLGQCAKSNRWPLRKPARCGWNVEDVFEHLAASLAEKRVIGAGGLDQGIEPCADPVQAADANPATVLWISQHHERSRGDVTKSTRQQLAAVEPFEHVVLEPIECKKRPNRLGREREFGVIRQMNRPAEIGDTKREVATDVAAEPGR